jgi:hypothetical protein
MKTWRYVLYKGDTIVVVKITERCYLLVKNIELVGVVFSFYFGSRGCYILQLDMCLFCGLICENDIGKVGMI